MPEKQNIYLSFDVETDGPSPSVNNLLSIGIYGIDDNYKEIFTFEANIKELPDKIQDADCMNNFWLKDEHKNAYNFLHHDQQNYIDVFETLSQKLKIISKTYNIIFVAEPSCFDWMFLKSYYNMTINNSQSNMYDIGFKCVCASTQWTLYKNHLNITSKQAVDLQNKLGEVDNSKLHLALFDAKYQGIRYLKVKKLLENKLSVKNNNLWNILKSIFDYFIKLF